MIQATRLHRSLAEHMGNRGENAKEVLAAGIAYGERALAGASGPETRLELARMYRQWGEYLQSRSQDPGAKLSRALELSGAIATESRDYRFYLHLGLAHKVWADYHDQVGQDSYHHRERAIAAYTSAIELDTGKSEAWLNLGNTYFARAGLPGNPDPEADLRQALVALDQGRAIDPQHIVPYFYGGEAHVGLARLARNRGADPGAYLDRAIESYRQGLAINPKIPNFHNGIGAAHIEQAHWAWDRGQNPDPLLGQARAAFGQAIAVAPTQAFAYSNIGFVLTWRAIYEHAGGRDPSATIRVAVAALEQAIERLPDAGPIWLNLGMAHAVLAGYQLEAGRDPSAAMTRATAALNQALDKNASDAQAHNYLGETRAIEARYRARAGARATPSEVQTLFERAAQSFERGLELAPENHDDRLRFGHVCRAWALWSWRAGRDPGPALERATAQADQLLAARPDWPDARLLRASQLLLRAQTSKRRDQQRDLARRARDDFTRALAENSNLAARWQDHARRARSMAAASD